MIAIAEAARNGLLHKKHFPNNLLAGIIVGIIALPLAMAFAIASGVAPEQGLYTAIISGFFVSVFGGSRVQIAGPTGAFIVLLSGILLKYGLAGLQIATTEHYKASDIPEIVAAIFKYTKDANKEELLPKIEEAVRRCK